MPAPDPGNARAGGADRYHPVPPTRLRESRSPLSAAEPVDVAGRAGVPAEGVRAVVLTVTARSAAPGAVTVWSGEGPRPPLATTEAGPDRLRTTTAVVGVGPDGRIAVASVPGPAEVTLDLTGWFPASSTLVTEDPVRLLDSRGTTVDGRDARRGPVQAGTAVPVQVGGRGGSWPAGSSVLLSVASSGATAPSGITVWPSGSPQPAVPSVPVAPGRDGRDLVYTAVGRDGVVDLGLARGTADVVVDLVAAVPARSAVAPVPPARVFDSRPGTMTTDGREASAGALTPGGTRRLPVGGRAGIPASATAVVAHLTATAATTGTTVRAWGDGTTPPPGPVTTAGPGETGSALVVLPLAPDGTFSVRADDGPADLAVDVQGWIGVGPEPPRAADEVLWRSDAEGWAGWKDTPWNDRDATGPRIVSTPVRGGAGAVQYTVEAGGRSEREPDVPNVREGDTRFFAVSTYLAPGFPTVPAGQVVTRWTSTGTGPVPLGVEVGRGRFSFTGGDPAAGTTFTRDIGPAPTGRWVDLVYGITFSATPARARVDAWMDGRQVVTDLHPPGGTLDGSSTSYLRTGLARTGPADRGVLTQDDWRIGTSYRAVTEP